MSDSLGMLICYFFESNYKIITIVTTISNDSGMLILYSVICKIVIIIVTIVTPVCSG